MTATATLQAGIARRFISPPKGIYQIGYGDRTRGNRGIHDDLTATALAFDDGNTRFALVACDLLAINERTVARVQAQAGEQIVICCAHTHSGPISYADRLSPKRNQRYIQYLVEQLAAVIHEAAANLQTAVLAWGEGEAHIAVNRRERKPDGSIKIGVNPEGEIDRSLQVLQVQRAGGNPLATVVNFACHNTVFGPNNLLVSADWAGAMRRNVEDKTDAPCMFLQGATGNLNPDHEWGEDDWKAVERLGSQVASEVLTSLENLHPMNGVPLKFCAEEAWLPLEAPANTPKPPPTYKAVLAKLAGVPRFLVNPILDRRYPWKTTIQARNGVWSIPMALTVLQIGELAIVAFGAEVFTEIGKTIKAQSPAKHTIFSSVSNGCIGYLPTSEEHALGGYEVDYAPYFYRLPGRLRLEAAEQTVNQAVKMLRAF